MKNKKVFFITILICLTVKTNAQTPANDQNWTLQFSDVFTSLPSWPNWSVDNNHYASGEPHILTNRAANVFLDNGELVLRTKKDIFRMGNFLYMLQCHLKMNQQ